MAKKGKKTLKGKERQVNKRMEKNFRRKKYIFFVSLVTKKSTNQGTNSLRFDPKREMSIEMQDTRFQLVNTGHVTHILQSDSLNFKIFLLLLLCSVAIKSNRNSLFLIG